MAGDQSFCLLDSLKMRRRRRLVPVMSFPLWSRPEFGKLYLYRQIA
jgi:hypothetical protein